MPFHKAQVKNTTVAFGTITGSYVTAIASAVGRFLEVKNTTNQDLLIKVKNVPEGEDVEVKLLAGDLAPKMYPMVFSGDVQVKHAGVAPASGTLFLQTICDGD